MFQNEDSLGPVYLRPRTTAANLNPQAAVRYDAQAVELPSKMSVMTLSVAGLEYNTVVLVKPSLTCRHPVTNTFNKWLFSCNLAASGFCEDNCTGCVMVVQGPLLFAD